MSGKYVVVVCVVIIILVLIGSISVNRRMVSPAPIEQLIRPFADALGPPSGVTFSGTEVWVWWGDAALVLGRDHHGAWNYRGIIQGRKKRLPSLFMALMVQAIRKRGPIDRPTDPWGRPLPEEAIHPEVRNGKGR